MTMRLAMLDTTIVTHNSDDSGDDGIDADLADGDAGVLASAMQVLEEIRNARAANARERLAWYDLTWTVPPQHARNR
eukprot:3849676-Pyramimonas_sp.AAC.1